MPGDNLQAVLKDVERAGSSFQQKYWVKIEEVQSLVKEHGWQEAMAKMGAAYGPVTSALHSWTSSSKSAGGLKIQGAAAVAMGMKVSDYPGGKVEHLKGGLEAGAADEKFQKALVALQAVTRAGLDNKGYKPRTMYRGMNGDIADAALQAAKNQADHGIPYHEAMMKLDLNPANSFSESENTAQGFGKFVVAVHEVPSSAYIAHFKVQGKGTVGFSSEVEGILATKEAFVLPIQDIRGAHGDKIVAYFKSKGLFDPTKVELDDHPPSKISGKRVGAAEAPKRPKKIDVPLYVKTPANLTDAQVHEHLLASGASIESKEKGATTVSVPSHKLAGFVESFSKTGSFDSALHKPESLKAYMEKKAHSLAGDDHTPDFGKGGEPTPYVPKGPKGPPKTKAVPKFLETISDLPPTGPVLHPKGEVGELANKETGWRGLWVKWAKQQAAASGHTGKDALVKAIHAVNERNGELKTFLKTKPTKPAFKAFLKAQVEKHLKK